MSNKPFCFRSLVVCCTSLLYLFIVGCSRLTDSYGPSDGKIGRESLNGFGALRTSFEKAGYETRDISRLSERVALTTTIVWTPQAVGPIPADVTKWFERWLATGGKTLVYVVPDSGSAAQYWRDAGMLAPPDQRLEYRRRAARELNRQLTWRLNRRPTTSNGWFILEPLEHNADVTELSSAWVTDGVSGLSFAAEYELHFRDADAVEVHNASLTSATPTTTPSFGATGPSGFTVVSDEAEPSDAIYSFESLVTGQAMLNAKEELTSVATTAPKTSPPAPKALPVRERRKLILAAKISKDDWQGSQIVVVNSGSLLTNYAFTREPSRRLAAELIESAAEVGTEEKFAGFVTTSGSTIPITEKQIGVPKATGMEMLTVWPISLITMHGVLFGLVICLMLFPIFGRPRRVQRINESNFGDHLDAVAVLMRKTGGEVYARQRISEYMRRVRGDSHGPWIIEHDSPSRIVLHEDKLKTPKPEPENVT